MNIWLPILGGAACKLYDELEDNIYLKQFKTALLMEGIKGLHYISYTVVSILDPLFFIIGYRSENETIYYFNKKIEFPLLSKQITNIIYTILEALIL